LPWLSKGRWTKQERLKFAYALFKFGTDWNKIKNYISTRNMVQLRSHAQKFLEKLKNDKLLVQKGLDFKNYNWKQSVEYLKENLREEEFMNVLYSIESELGDNNRMTEKYLERKRLRAKSTLEELNTASSFDESHTFFSGNKLNEDNSDNGSQSNTFPDIINLEEENNNKIDLFQNYFDKNYTCVYNIFKKDLFSIDENSFDSEQDSLEFKNQIYAFAHVFKL
jgi:SHAQKYF class myb-like DNA-binding protein